MNSPKKTLEPNEIEIKVGRKYIILTLISLEEAEMLRAIGMPSLIYKKNGQLFHKEISRSDFFSFGTHLCASGTSCCQKLSAASDEEGGCAKVRDVGKSKKIEKYDFIKEGYETFGVRFDSFIVLNCQCYVKA